MSTPVLIFCVPFLNIDILLLLWLLVYASTFLPLFSYLLRSNAFFKLIRKFFFRQAEMVSDAFLSSDILFFFWKTVCSSGILHKELLLRLWFIVWCIISISFFTENCVTDYQAEVRGFQLDGSLHLQARSEKYGKVHVS